MKRIRITLEIDVPNVTDRKEFNAEIMRIMKAQFGGLKYLATEPVSYNEDVLVTYP